MLSLSLMAKKNGNYECEACGITFYKEDNYRIHKEHYCSGTASRVIGAAMLAQVTHGSLGEGSSRSPVAAISTLPITNARQYNCRECGVKFRSLDTLTAHQKYYCKSTGAATLCSKISDMHNVLVSSPKLSPTGVKSSPISSSPVSPIHGLMSPPPPRAPSPTYRCEICADELLSKSHLIEHIAASHLPSQPTRPQASASKIYRCISCGYRGTTIRGMKMHGKVHQDQGESYSVDENVVEYSADLGSSTTSKSHTVAPVVPSHAGTALPYKRRVSRKMMTMLGGKPAQHATASHAHGPLEQSESRDGSSTTDTIPTTSSSLVTTTSAAKTESPKKNGLKYCKNCDINFNFLSSFLTHKKFYCTSSTSVPPPLPTANGVNGHLGKSKMASALRVTTEISSKAPKLVTTEEFTVKSEPKELSTPSERAHTLASAPSTTPVVKSEDKSVSDLIECNSENESSPRHLESCEDSAMSDKPVEDTTGSQNLSIEEKQESEKSVEKPSKSITQTCEISDNAMKEEASKLTLPLNTSSLKSDKQMEPTIITTGALLETAASKDSFEGIDKKLRSVAEMSVTSSAASKNDIQVSDKAISSVSKCLKSKPTHQQLQPMHCRSSA